MAAAMPSSAEQRLLSDVRVLVVEDESDQCQCAIELLAYEGAWVDAARTGNTGFAVFRERRPDVIVSDLWMPDGTGYDLIERVRELPPEKGGLTPAVAVSSAENMASALAAGFHAFLGKPFDIEALVRTIRDFACDEDPQEPTPWTLTRDAGRVVITVVGHLDAGDMHVMTRTLLAHLEDGPLDIVADARLLTGFSPSVGSIGERAVWLQRRKIRSVRIVGSSLAGRLVSAAACRALGIPCSFAESMDEVIR